MTAEELKDLRNKLPRGWINRLSKKSGFERSTVHKVLHGKSTNTKVLDALLEMLKEDKQRDTELKQFIES
jgi:predicted transcriptional regulator